MLEVFSPAICLIFAAMFIAVIVELALKGQKGWEEDGEPQGKQANAKSQRQKGHAASQPLKQENESDQEEPVDAKNEVGKEEKLQETTTS